MFHISYRVIAIFLTALVLSAPGCALLQLGDKPQDEGPGMFDPGPRAARIPAGAYPSLPEPGPKDPEIDEDEIAAAQARAEARLEEALQSRDILLGMSMTQVRQAWGSPAEIDVAGDSRYGNERWAYSWGLPGWRKKRVVYFEGGQVAGWEAR